MKKFLGWFILIVVLVGGGLITIYSIGFKPDLEGLNLPSRFFIADYNRGFDYRAVTADDNALAATIQDAYESQPEFWKDLIRRSLVDFQGYTLLDENEITFGDGTKGHFWKSKPLSEEPEYRHFVAVCPYKHWWPFADPVLIVWQYSGKADSADADLADVQKALSQWKP